jgi:group I intron endonuclease
MDIYKIENLINGKVYVGQSTNLTVRFAKHRKNARKKVNRYLYDAMNKYSHENFSISLIEKTTKENADTREIFWIAELGTLHPNGYNMTRGGGGGYTLSSWSKEERKNTLQTAG